MFEILNCIFGWTYMFRILTCIFGWTYMFKILTCIFGWTYIFKILTCIFGWPMQDLNGQAHCAHSYSPERDLNGIGTGPL